ncbi:DUF2971 domain-containing protein [Pontivivens insulae]|uniref:DUF2971 domain-containing protein n=1 Tax=Pontivivens insulae TaxID=1639689 RepID=A0A2R8AD05_9RHOB|nr:DUF2971 domain-containing protein [Pontivivens insulae]RED14053.1 hypothetical protein DFR53_1405 [Pontivivens insulae]SPF30127.1 hypothetical protein POI8812_02459 [Pontivivens insulae]
MIQNLIDAWYSHEEAERKSFANGGGYLAHYTSAQGAHAILNNNELWLTNVGSMNDLSEVHYARQVLQSLFADPLTLPSTFVRTWPRLFIACQKIVMEKLTREIVHGLITRNFVSCFSAENPSDDADAGVLKYGRLSMWRGYGRDTPVRLAISGRALTADGPSPNAPCVPVCYGKLAAFEALLKCIQSLLDASADESEFSNEAIEQAANHFVRLALLTIKHPAFAEENEWRLIYNTDYGRDDGLITQRQVSRLGTVDLIEVLDIGPNPPHFRNGWHDLVPHITIGPSRHQIRTAAAFGALVESRGLDPNSLIRIADVPFQPTQ